jgi:pimeloyl-ACP methyl ester carboxylesterase
MVQAAKTVQFINGEISFKSHFMQTAATKQSEKNYFEEGNGETIILLYGLFGSVNNFRPLIQHLKKKHRVIVPIFPFFSLGMGVDIYALTDFVHNLTEELGLEKFSLLGNSMGGHIAILYTLKHPGRVSSLILSGSSGLFENGMGDSYPKRGSYEYIRAKTALTFYNPAIASKELVDEIYATVNSRRAIQIVSLAKSTIRNNVEKELHRIKIPCCLVWGCNDTITAPAVARSFKRLLPQAQLYWIDECGHVPMLERPDEFNRLMDRFFSSVTERTGRQLEYEQHDEDAQPRAGY